MRIVKDGDVEAIEDGDGLLQFGCLRLAQDAAVDEDVDHHVAIAVGVGRIDDLLGAQHRQCVVLEHHVGGRQQVERLDGHALHAADRGPEGILG